MLRASKKKKIKKKERKDVAHNWEFDKEKHTETPSHARAHSEAIKRSP
jgi:hypothetical protein